MKKIFDKQRFETERLYIDSSTKEDLDIFVKLYSTKLVTENFLTEYYRNPKELENDFDMLLKMTENERYFSWIIKLKSNDEKIGIINLSNINFNSKRSDIGYILDPVHWGNGFINEALILLLDFFFNKSDFNKLCASVNSINKKSCSVLERLKFSREGNLENQHYHMKKNSFADEVLFGLTKQHYLSKH